MQCRLKPIHVADACLRRYLIKASARSIHPSHFQNLARFQPEKAALFSTHTDRPAVTPESLFKKHKVTAKPRLVICELCCGTGDFINSYAKKWQEDVLCIGVDYALPCIQRAIKKADAYGLDNVLFYWGEGTFFLQEEIARSSFDRIMINFPDPWPKKRHRKRRLLRETNAAVYTEALKIGGELFLSTDVADLHAYHKTLLKQVDALDLLVDACVMLSKSHPKKGAYDYEPLNMMEAVTSSVYARKNLSGSKKLYALTYRHR